MLQQTRVETVIPYYERWLARFPTLTDLAEAELDEVLKHWEGLGYYSRARNLHRATRIVRERHGGTLPADPAALRQLPGIGDYTAGAIASIAFGLPEPAVDGNVRRVFSRLFDLPDPGAAELRAIAARLVPEDRPGDFNQALMELGATVCTPRSPTCGTCPAESLCLARARGIQLERPLPKPKKAIPEDDVATAVLIAADGRTLLTRRPEDGLLGGLWEFPAAAIAADEEPALAAARAAATAYGAELPGTPRPEPVGNVVHTFTHRRTTYRAFRFRLTMPAPSYRQAADAGGPTSRSESEGERREAAWVTPAELAEYTLPVAQRKIAALALGADRET